MDDATEGLSRRRQLALVAIGSLIIAACYGLGRNAYGLLVPQMQQQLGLSSLAIGVVGGMAHVGYGSALYVSPAVCRRRGAALVAVFAAMVTAVGLFGLAGSRGVVSLALSACLAGSGSGLASPALAQLVVERLRWSARSAAQTWINSGNSLGIAASAPALLVAGAFRAVWATFALVTLVVAVLAGRVLLQHGEGASGCAPVVTRPTCVGGWSGLVSAAVLLGATSAPYWTFSVQRVVNAGVSESWSVWFWVAIGAAGLAGGTAGATADERGIGWTVRAWGVAWTASLALLSVPALPGLLAVVSAAAFGAAFMALTGLLMLWATHLSDEAAAGVRAAFLTLAVGQAAATPLAGLLADIVGLPMTFAFAAIASIGLFVLPGRPARRLHATHPNA